MIITIWSLEQVGMDLDFDGSRTHVNKPFRIYREAQLRQIRNRSTLADLTDE